MNVLEHIVAKWFSARWVWGVTCAFTFAWLACTGMLDPKDALGVIGAVLGFYFGARTAADAGRKTP